MLICYLLIRSCYVPDILASSSRAILKTVLGSRCYYALHSQMRTMSLSEGKRLSQVDRVSKWQTWRHRSDGLKAAALSIHSPSASIVKLNGAISFWQLNLPMGAGRGWSFGDEAKVKRTSGLSDVFNTRRIL